MPRVIFHLDMDAFYASVEQRDHPEWKGKPVIVGSPPDRRGVVCASSYEARAFGVRSAMPSRTAGRLCPEGVFVRPRMERYRSESKAVMDLVTATCGEHIQQVSVDEAYIDVSAQVDADLSPDEAHYAVIPLARLIKAAILRERGLTATVGIGPNKLLAKIGSDFHKPDGLTVIYPSQRESFLRPLPVRVIRGVGSVTEKVLTGAGLHTVAHIQDYKGDLRALVGSWGPELAAAARGIDDRPLDMDDEVKSISAESTFLKDTDDRSTLRNTLWENAEDVAKKLARHGLGAWTVQVKVRYSDFSTLTRQLSLTEPLMETREIYRVGCWLLAKHSLVHRPLRLLGIGVANLRELDAIQMKWEFETKGG